MVLKKSHQKYPQAKIHLLVFVSSWLDLSFVKEYIKLLILIIFLAVGTATTSAQITRLSLDLKNNISFVTTQQTQGTLNLKTYGQFYVLGLAGYMFNKKLLEFNLQTSLTDFSSTSEAVAFKQELRSRNFGYYNFMATILPRDNFPLTIYASRNQTDNKSSRDLLLSALAPVRYLIENQSAGMRWRILKTAYTPQIEMTFEHKLTLNESSLFPINQKNDIWSIRLNNESEGGKSQYSFQYSGVHIDDKVFKLKQTNHQFQFYGSSKISDRTDVYSNASYYVYDKMTNRNTEVGGTFRQSTGGYYRLRVMNSESRSILASAMRNIINGINGESYIVFSDIVQGNFGINYTERSNKLGDVHSSSDNGQLKGQLNYRRQFTFADINASLGTNLGFESYPSDGRKFVQQTQFSLGGISQIIPHFQFELYDNINLSTNYFFGNVIQNNFRVKAATNVIPRSMLSVEFTHFNNRYIDFDIMSPRSVNAVNLMAATQILPTIRAEVQHSKSWAYSWYTEQTTRTLFMLTTSGFFPNLSLQVRGERAENSVTKITVMKLEGIFKYRFYAFTFGGKFSLYSVAGVRTQGIMFEVRRPFNFNF